MPWLALIAVGAFIVASIPLASVVSNLKPNDFYQAFLDAAKQTNLGGFSPRILLAVASYETGYGSGHIFQQTKNLFSITKSSSWTGEIYSSPNGYLYKMYDNLSASIEDFIKLMNIPRYQFAREAAQNGDVYKFFQELQKAGYGDPGKTTYAQEGFDVYQSLNGVA